MLALALQADLSELAKRERAKAAGEAGGRGRPRDDSLSAHPADKLSDTPKRDTRKEAAAALAPWPVAPVRRRGRKTPL